MIILCERWRDLPSHDALLCLCPPLTPCLSQSRLDTSISQTAPALLATLLATNSIDDTTTSQVDAIQTLTKLDDDEWVEIKADMYTLYLDNMLKSETTTTSDVPDLTKLSR